MSPASLRPRDLILVGYSGNEWSQQKVLLKRISRNGKQWVVVTPHGDVYIDDFSEYTFWHKLGPWDGLLSGSDRPLYERMVAFPGAVFRNNIDGWLRDAALEEAEPGAGAAPA